MVTAITRGRISAALGICALVWRQRRYAARAGRYSPQAPRKRTAIVRLRIAREPYLKPVVSSGSAPDHDLRRSADYTWRHPAACIPQEPLKTRNEAYRR